MVGKRWTQPEERYLETMAGEIPFPELVRRMQERAAEQGWRVRSAGAIAEKLKRLGVPCRVRDGEWLLAGAVEEILGCPRGRVSQWLSWPHVRRVLQPKRFGTYWYSHRNGWRRVAQQLPQLLGGFSADRLFVLLEDRELADAIASTYRETIGDRQRRSWRIRCKNTGMVYASAVAAAKRYCVTPAAINKAIEERRPVKCLGLTFERLVG